MIKIISRKRYNEMIERIAFMCERIDTLTKQDPHQLHIGDRVKHPLFPTRTMYFVSRWWNQATCEYRDGGELKQFKCEFAMLQKVK